MSKKQNKWNQIPSEPPPQLFTGQKERDLAKHISDEVIEKIIGQPLVYYPLDIERTDFHSLYGEAIKKSFLPPIRVYGLVEFEDEGTNHADSFGVEKRTKLKVHFNKRRLTEDQNLFVTTGDVLEYNQIFYEIVSLSEPKQLFGRADTKTEVMAECNRIRWGTFNAE